MPEETVMTSSVRLSLCGVRRGVAIAACLVVLAVQAAQAQVMIVAPHPDDEALFASGIIYQAHQGGKNVKVVIATNGDCQVPSIGTTRQQETIAGMAVLGVPAEDVIFLGYPDCGLSELYYNYQSVQSQYTSIAGFNKTYASEGLGGTDHHSRIYGVPAPYNGFWMTEDLKNLFLNYKPQDVYVTSAYDDNRDHSVLNFFVTEALLSLIRSGAAIQPTLHDAIVHAPCELCDPMYRWPMPTFTPTVAFPMPPSLATRTPLGWSDIESVDVPVPMRSPDSALNLKYQAIARYTSQFGSGEWLESFVKSNEIFWKWDLWANLALKATATASSARGPVDRLNDASVVGSPQVPLGFTGKGEWVSDGELAGAFAVLTWPTPQVLTSIVLHDRPDLTENVTSIRLTFSDGTFINVPDAPGGPTLPTNGVGFQVPFAAKSVTWVKFTVLSAVGTAAGLSEIEAYGAAGVKTLWQPPAANTLPAISAGPTASPSAIDDLSTSLLTVSAMDADADPLTYSWTTSGGRIQGSGASVTFVPPSVTAPTSFRVDVHVADGRGGVASSYVMIMVSRSFDPHNVATLATATSSSARVEQTADRAIDGIVGGYPVDVQREWSSAGELTGAWIRLTWATPQKIGRSILHDRINLSDHILAGSMTFSDGSTLMVGALPNDGSGLTQDFAAPKTVTWVQFTVVSAAGESAGLAEWEIFTAVSPGGHVPDVVIDFGPVHGLWLSKNPRGATPDWSQLNVQSPTLMATADLDGNDQADLIANFQGYGVWVWSNNTSWTRLHPYDVTDLVVGDLDGNGRPDLVMSFPGYGVWAFMNNTTWVQLHTREAAGMDIGNLDNDSGHRDEVVVNFPGSGVWIWTNNTTWVQLNAKNASHIRTADMDGNGKIDVALDFPGDGLWTWMNNDTWIQRHTLNTTGMTSGNLDGDVGGRADLVVGFEGYGEWVLMNNTTWTQLYPTLFGAMTTADLDFNGRADLVVTIPGAGVYTFMNNTNWVQLHPFDGQDFAAGRIDSN